MLSVIIPAYNEENRILSALKKVKNELAKRDEVIVVADGKDKTAKLAKTIKGIKVLEFKNRLGKGGALKEGVKVAKGNIIVFCDVDYGTQENVSINNLVKNLDDINIGSRYISTYIKGDSKRIFFSRGLNFLVRIMFGLHLTDTQCGFKAFRRDVIKKIMPLVKIKGFAYDIEVLWRAKKLGYAIKEVPIRWDYTKETKVNVLKTSIEIFKDMLKLRFT
jgi:glycosyltransferase involved in cell wall biosynthesis